jgi:hypothetical protein
MIDYIHCAVDKITRKILKVKPFHVCIAFNRLKIKEEEEERKEKMGGGGGGVVDKTEEGQKKTIFSPVLKVSRQCPLVLLVEVRLREGKALGSGKV